MENNKFPPPLRRVFLHLILFRVFLPLMIVGVTAVVGAGYFGKQNLLNRQAQVVQSTAELVEHHLEYGGKILDAVARVAETVGTKNLNVFMQSTWESYGYFETLYYLDENNKVSLLMPSELNYSGLDMSYLPDFKINKEQQNFKISRPFVSIRTGEPTVYLVRALAHGGSVVGELNLGLFQKEIEKIANSPENNFVFILDQRGNVLAHPDKKLVQQQVNLSNIGIFGKIAHGIQSASYRYNDRTVLGSASLVNKTGWIVVDQIPVTVFLSSYAWVFALVFISSIIVWMTLVLSFRKTIQRNVISPIERLSLVANALAIGDYAQINSLQVGSASFSELYRLTSDFQTMSDNLQARETALKLAHDELEGKVEERTKELSVINESLVKMSGNLHISNMDLKNEVAERKHAEELLAQKVLEIEQAHEELKNAQLHLLQQEKMASIGQLAAGVAHEINNPIGFVNSNLGTLRNYVNELLRLIDGYSELNSSAPGKTRMSDDAISKMRKEIDFEFIRIDADALIAESIDGTSRVKRIVQSLRDFAQIGSVEWLCVDINEGLENTISLLGNELNSKAVLIRDFEKLPPVECIPSQINQVFMCILINASQSIPGQGEIIIRSRHLDNEVCVAISDNGTGITQENLSRIFDPFFTTRTVGKGVGLGLSIAYGIIKNHGGRIEVQSVVGQGSTFSVYLPLRHRTESS
ncbi:MAG: ATP-binding protein [Formivibrio sp.]|nr:ATP-binding protein [Formivibrio sp.]